MAATILRSILISASALAAATPAPVHDPTYLDQLLSPGNLPEWIQGVASILAALAGLFVLLQLVLMKRQLAQGTDQLRNAQQQLQSAIQWNKLNAAFTYFQTQVFNDAEKDAFEALRKINLDLWEANSPLSSTELTALLADRGTYGAVKRFLNLTEDYAAAVNLGAIDGEAGYAMMENVVRKWYRVFGPLIMNRRAQLEDPLVYCELQKLAERWSKRHTAEQEGRTQNTGTTARV